MTGVIATIPRIQFSNALGIPLAGGKLTTYLAGTTTPEATYQDQELTTKNPTTITLDATGSCVLWLDPEKSYKFLLKSALGVTQPGWPVDNITGASNLTSLSPTLSLYTKFSTLAAAAGSTLMGFAHKLTGAKKRTISNKLSDTLSLADFDADGGDGIGKGNASKDTAAMLAFVQAVQKDYYNKGAICLEVPVPDVPYQLTETIDLSECWNVTIRCGSAFGFQRQQAVDVGSDNALFHWYGPTGGTMLRLHYTFGMEGERLSLNGRGKAKIGVAITPSASGPSVTRKVDFEAPIIKNCDFGILIGDLAAQTDNAPVNLVRPYVSGCSSAGVVVNSGNASVNLVQPWFINNGYAPTKGNGFISDGANRGCHLNVVAGFVGVTDWTSDHDPDHVLAGAAICQSSGSLRINGAWCDDPNKPFYSGFADRAIYMNGVTHYDASMTLATTPNSIEHSGPQPLVLESCTLYGNVSITSGNQASVIDHGTRFMRAGAGYIGDMVTTFGGLARTSRTGNNSLASSVGGDFPAGIGGHHSHTIWSDSNRTGLVRAVRNGGYKITEYINSDNGQMYTLGNAYFDADVGQYKAIAPGMCWRHSYGTNSETFDAFQAPGVGAVITWSNMHGFLPGTGSNAIPILTLGGQKLTWDSSPPSTGQWTKGDRCLNLNVAVGQPKGWVCTSNGQPGTWVSEGNL